MTGVSRRDEYLPIASCTRLLGSSNSVHIDVLGTKHLRLILNSFEAHFVLDKMRGFLKYNECDLAVISWPSRTIVSSVLSLPLYFFILDVSLGDENALFH